ncbi:hypothetical protein J4403_00665 [Candidatus Woesearchaeota archaeon]|nr:hypothetical protein [Candidatus Woesearchaeota archaeon]
MATPLDISLLTYLLPVFVAIMIYVVLYAVLVRTKVLGESNSINAWVALALALLFLAMPGAVKFISFVAPWFVTMVIIALCVFLVFLFMGMDLAHIKKYILVDSTVMWIALMFSIVIVVAGLIATFGQFFGADATVQAGEIAPVNEIQYTFSNSRLIAAVFLFVIAVFAVKLLSGPIAMIKKD